MAAKQGRIAGENALGGERRFAGSLGTQVLRAFELVAARTGLRDPEARAVGFDPATVGISHGHGWSATSKDRRQPSKPWDATVDGG